jgi:Ser/Thr protein kinase RdoA (MazF antagonist)
MRIKTLTEENFCSLLQPKIEAVIRFFSDRSKLSWDPNRFKDNLSRHLCGKAFAVSAVHGDLWSGNVLAASDGTCTGIVDWDDFQEEGFTCLDLVKFVVFWRVARHRMRWNRAIEEMLLPFRMESLSEEEQAFLLPHLERDMFSIASATAAGILYLLDMLERNTAALGPFEISLNPPRQLQRVVEAIARYVKESPSCPA